MMPVALNGLKKRKIRKAPGILFWTNYSQSVLDAMIIEQLDSVGFKQSIMSC